MATQQQEIYIEDVGTVLFRKSNKAKRISIRIRRGRPAEVVIPSWSSFKSGRQFAQKKKHWIRKHTEEQPGLKEIPITEQTVIRTISSTIRFRFLQNGTARTRIIYNTDTLIVEFGKGKNISDSAVQDMIYQSLYALLKKDAMTYLTDRLVLLANRYGYQFNRVRIKHQKTLWGSCSVRNNINLNLHLILLPAHLIDYVLVHELVHTRFKNHGPQFWNAVDLCLGNGKGLARELRNYSIGLFAKTESDELQLFKHL